GALGGADPAGRAGRGVAEPSYAGARPGDRQPACLPAGQAGELAAGGGRAGPSGAGHRRMLRLSPVGRGGTLDEVATVAALLLGPDGAFITGSDILMDGGGTGAWFFGELTPDRSSRSSSACATWGLLSGTGPDAAAAPCRASGRCPRSRPGPRRS